MSNPIIFNKGVKYIKLAKFDTGSNSDNLTTQLGEINSIRVNYSDKGIIEYPISSIIEHDTYYLYRVSTTDTTSSVDNKQLDYNFLGFKTSSQTFDLGKTGISNYNEAISSDSLGYFNFNSGLYTYGDTPNKTLRIQFTASFAITGSGASNFVTGSVILRQKGIGNIATVTFQTSSTGANNTDFIVKGAGPVFRPIETEGYNFRVDLSNTSSDHPSIPVTFTLNDFKYKLLTGSAEIFATSSGNQLPVVIEPFFTEPFYNGDYDVLVNNTPNARRSNFFFDVDYSDNIIQAVNQQVLISSSQQGRLGAPYARIQDYNYNIDRSLLPRYKGSRITKDAVNSISSSKSAATQSLEPGQNLGVDTSGQPIVESLNTVAYNANFGGGTTPEILGLGGLSINSMLLVGNNRDDVNSIPSANANFSDIIQTSIEPGDLVSVYQYGDTTVNVPGTLEVVETKLSVPPKSTYMISKDNSETNAKLTSSYAPFNGKDGIAFPTNVNSGVFPVRLNDSGKYAQGARIPSASFLPDFKTTFDNSENDWYVSLYTSLADPVVNIGNSATVNYEFTSTYDVSDPFGYYGVSKIIDVVTESGGGLVLDRTLPSVLNNGIVGQSYGILIWESWGNQIIVRGNTLSGLGKSLVYSQNSPSTIKDNLGYISDTYGS